MDGRFQMDFNSFKKYINDTIFMTLLAHHTVNDIPELLQFYCFQQTWTIHFSKPKLLFFLKLHI